MKIRFAFIWIVIAVTCINPLAAQDVISLWKGMKGGCPFVTLTPYLPSEATNRKTAVIICPGGSYCWLDTKNENSTVGKWLQKEGFAAFVLKYRTAGIPAYATHYRLLAPRHQHPNMIQDLQRAIQWIRMHASEYHIDAHKVGVMGFSAGGHLVLMSGTFSHTDFLSMLKIKTETSLRPDFIAAIYPVVTFSDKSLTHRRSRRGILGEWKKNKSIMQDSLSLEKHIPDDMPPVFLANCQDDPTVKYRNSVIMDSALTIKRIPHIYHQYKSGGHGFGSNPKPETDAATWKSDFLEWIHKIGY